MWPENTTEMIRTATGANGTILMGLPGLWIALADEDTDTGLAASDLRTRMLAEDVSTGTVILSQSLAARTFGPVPAKWLAAGISMHRSIDVDLRRGAQAFLTEYLQLLSFMKASMDDLDRIVQS